MLSPSRKNMPLLRLNQLPDFFVLSVGRSVAMDGWYEACVDAMLGEDGRLRLLYWDCPRCCWSLGICSEVRELLKEDRRLLKAQQLAHAG